MFLSIVIPTHNKLSWLELCLKAIDQARLEIVFDFEVIIINDYSTDGTNLFLEELSSTTELRLSIVYTPERIGRSCARNSGGRVSKGKVILFCDDDILLTAAAVNRHCELHQGTSNILGRGSILNLPWLSAVKNLKDFEEERLPIGIRKRIYDMLNGEILVNSVRPFARKTKFEADIWRLFNETQKNQNKRWPGVTGGSLSVTKSFFDSLGGFDQKMGLVWGAEDLEFGYRAEGHGGKVIHIDQFPVFHLDHPKPNRDYQHQIALKYFVDKHQEAGTRLIAYFNGSMDICEIDQNKLTF